MIPQYVILIDASLGGPKRQRERYKADPGCTLFIAARPAFSFAELLKTNRLVYGVHCRVIGAETLSRS